ncbi:MAG: adenylate/guanylate cyclase domain-containing protein [Bacteroidetes bacterium]|nr:adenylate/guanylate cyclase domain-containing protein [Bacteroidota bacterium]
MNNKYNAFRSYNFTPYMVGGFIIATLSSVIEYFIRINTNDPQQFIPLFIRSHLATIFLAISVAVFEKHFKKIAAQRTFLFLVLIRSISLMLIISFWLFVMNGIWIGYHDQKAFWEGIIQYWSDNIYIINLVSIFIVLTILIGISQITYLFRKGEFFNFIIGRYHRPKEIERIFCFIDLTASTTIAEKLEHYQFGNFLKDYYADITLALKQTKAEIYLYVGDEIILSWTYKNALKDNNMLRCFFLMRDIIQQLKPKYLDRYGFIPEFKSGMHGGKVIVTWVGELKKEIVYLGDVLNTTSRIQEDCKRLDKDFLISKDILDHIKDLDGFEATFVEETIPRGKEKAIKLFSIKRIKQKTS